MLKYNTYRSTRYLRSVFVEGAYLLASEASDIELESIAFARNLIQNSLGESVAIDNSWKTELVSSSQIRLVPGEAWINGLPFNLRSGKDQLVTLGIVPTGVTLTYDTTGALLSFDGTVTTDLYRIIISAHEDRIDYTEDAFLKNNNLSESTSQKIRLIYKINVISNAIYDESPIPYTGNSATDKNLTSKITISPTVSGPGELISTMAVPGSEAIDGRDIELHIKNLSPNNVLPIGTVDQASYANGKLIDSNGTEYHINLIFQDPDNLDQTIIRIDKELGQLNPVLTNGSTYTVLKKDVYVEDNTSGEPTGSLYWSISTVDWSSIDYIVHESKITDLRTTISKLNDYEAFNNNKASLRISGGADINWNSLTQILLINDTIDLINPHGIDMSIASSSTPILEGGSLAYDLDLVNGGAIEKGSLAITVTAFGATSTLSTVNLSQVKIGNIVKDSAGIAAKITDIDNVNDTIATTPALTANGAGTIYYDSFSAGNVPLSKEVYILAVRKNDVIYIDGGLDLSNGETGQISDSISWQLLTFMGALSDTDDAPVYGTNYYVTDSSPLNSAIGALDSALNTESINSASRGVKIIGGGTITWTSPNLTFTADMYLEIKGLSYTDNIIAFSTQSPIALSSSLQAAYVVPNLTTGGPSLTVTVGALTSVPNNAIIIVRREGTEVIVGSSSTRLKSGQSTQLYAQSSNQTLDFIGSTSTADYQPNYSDTNYVADNDSLVTAIGKLDAAMAALVTTSSFTIANNQSSLTDITGLLLSTVTVRSANIKYSVYRTTSSSTSGNAETGTIYLVYDTNATSGNKWLLSQISEGDAGIIFGVTDTGQIQYKSTNISGTSYSGVIKYNVKTLLQ